MSLFATMNLANSALHASQLGINIAGHNIANADRPGFSRQRVDQHALYRRSAQFGQMGFGVGIGGISRIRNEFIDTQIRRQSFELGKHKAIDHALESMENIVREPSDTGIMEFMNRFFNSWEFLASNPDDKSARTAIVASADLLVRAFNNVASELYNLKASRNSEMIVVVGEINNIARDIFNLNAEISIAEVAGGNANDSRDRRDLLMRRLAELVDYDSVVDSNGQVSISLNGHILVSAVSVNTLEVFTPLGVSNDPQGFTQLGLRMTNGRGEVNPSGGQLAGLIEARDVFIPRLEQQLDQLADALVTAINEQHRKGYNLRGHTGLNFFEPQKFEDRVRLDPFGNPVLHTSGPLVGQPVVDRIVTPVTARTIRVSSGITSDVGNIAAAAGGGVMSEPIRNSTPVGGMPPVGTLFFLAKDPIAYPNGWIPSPHALPPYDPTNDIDRAKNLVSGTVIVRAGNTQLVEGRDFHVDYVLGTIQLLAGGAAYVGEELEIDFRFMTGNFTGVGDNDNAIEISKLRNTAVVGNTNIFGNPTSTFGEFYGAAVAQLGLDRRESMANLATRQFLIDGYDEHQDSIAGVSLDEEAANIMRLQYSYQAAARIFSSVQSMLDILLNL